MNLDKDFKGIKLTQLDQNLLLFFHHFVEFDVMQSKILFLLAIGVVNLFAFVLNVLQTI